MKALSNLFFVPLTLKRRQQTNLDRFQIDKANWFTDKQTLNAQLSCELITSARLGTADLFPLRGSALC